MKEGRKNNFLSSPYLSIRVKYSRPDDSGFFIVVSKTFSKKAIERNLFKRRVRSILRKEQKNNFFKNKSITIFLKKEAKKIPFSDLEKEVKKLLSKI